MSLEKYNNTGNNPLNHLEHLSVKFDPIDVEKVSIEEIMQSPRKDLADLINAPEAIKLDYYAENGTDVLSAGLKTYVISPITTNTVYSYRYVNCQGLVASGVQEDGERIAFQTHHDPRILGDEKLSHAFQTDLTTRLNELRLQLSLIHI